MKWSSQCESNWSNCIFLPEKIPRLQRDLNRDTGTIYYLKKMLEKSIQFLSSEQASGPKSLKCFLEYCWSWKNTLGKHAVAVNTRHHFIWVLNERRVTDGRNLCPLWLVILKLVWHGIGDTLWLQYSCPRAVVSYTFLAVVPCSRLEHSCRKVRLREFKKWWFWSVAQSPCPFGGGRKTFTDIVCLMPLVKPDFCLKLRYTLFFTRKV